MKRFTIVAVCLWLAVATLQAQSVVDSKLSDREVNEKLLTDLNQRFPETRKEIIVWDNTLHGYDALYSIDKSDFLSRYDKNGTYLYTFLKKAWNADVPEVVRKSYTKSIYGNYPVNTYWELRDASRKGFYMELKDKQGKPLKIWMDDQGKVYDAPNP
jgi:hypothetical protein